jgi:hypothetical protein
MDLVGDGFDQTTQEVGGGAARHLLMQFDEGELRAFDPMSFRADAFRRANFKTDPLPERKTHADPARATFLSGVSNIRLIR